MQNSKDTKKGPQRAMLYSFVHECRRRMNDYVSNTPSNDSITPAMPSSNELIIVTQALHCEEHFHDADCGKVYLLSEVKTNIS